MILFLLLMMFNLILFFFFFFSSRRRHTRLTCDWSSDVCSSDLSPKIIAKYCYQLAVSFNTFYEHVKVLTADSESTVNARLCLVYSFKETLAKALQLLGIDAPERM